MTDDDTPQHEPIPETGHKLETEWQPSGQERGLNRAVAIIHDPEKVASLAKKVGGMTMGISITAVAMAFGLFYVKQEQPLEVFISATLGWSGYLFAHYAATGKFIHQKQEQHLFPQDNRKILGGIFGALVLAAGIAIWAIALQQGDRITSILGAFVFLSGYIISHYEFTGDLL